MRLLQVELDAAVLEVATREMGLPADRANLRLHCADGAAWMAATARAVVARTEPPLDLVLLDAFDGDDAVPACFTQPGAAAQPYPTIWLIAKTGVQAPKGSSCSARIIDVWRAGTQQKTPAVLALHVAGAAAGSCSL